MEWHPHWFNLGREKFIEGVKDLDEKSGASLKLTVLNPRGRVWTLVAGGGASVVYTDTVFDLGFKDELANYGEYSGNPSTDETYQYTKTILDLMTRENDPRGKILLIGGGIANFLAAAATVPIAGTGGVFGQVPDSHILGIPDFRGVLGDLLYVRVAVEHIDDGVGRFRQGGNFHPRNQLAGRAVPFFNFVVQVFTGPGRAAAVIPPEDNVVAIAAGVVAQVGVG